MKIPRWLLAGALSFAAASAFAQPSPNGGEFQVNTYTSGRQGYTSVASDPEGNFVVVWDNDVWWSVNDTSTSGIQAQRYDAAGAPLGPQFQVSSSTTGPRARPDVAVAGSGNFVVVARGGESTTDIYAQRFGADGIPLADEIQVNTLTWGFWDFVPFTPAVASDAAGGFVVVWPHLDYWLGRVSDEPDTDGWSVQARRFDANGVPLGDQFQVNAYTTSSQFDPDVACDSAGNFVVVWTSHGSYGPDTSQASVQGQRYDVTGAPLGSQFQVNTLTSGYQGQAAVASDSAGNFVVAWKSLWSETVRAQRYDANGAPSGGELVVNTYAANFHSGVAVASSGAGDFVVAWDSVGSTGGDTSNLSIQTRRYRADGLALGDQFQVNTYTTGSQLFPSVAPDARGNFVVAWESLGSSGSDDSDRSIQAQRFDAMLRDGFETGDTSRWSGAVP